ncbi:MAG TPA: hypothetical protein VN840_17355 [Streptosporangiaceae bacterium]|nr:hypothetical protein [Streptosporangiaceae bacterium]
MSEMNAGAAYAGLIADQLAEERNRKTSLEARGITVITTSGTLATLLFALTAGLTTAAKFRLPGPARLPLLLALVAFVAAAAFGLATNLPLRYQEPTSAGLARLVSARYWSGPAEIGQLRVAEAEITALAAARSANGRKVTLLLAAILSEVLAVVFLTWAIAVVLYNS